MSSSWNNSLPRVPWTPIIELPIKHQPIANRQPLHKTIASSPGLSANSCFASPENSLPFRPAIPGNVLRFLTIHFAFRFSARVFRSSEAQKKTAPNCRSERSKSKGKRHVYFYRKTPVKSNCFFRDDRRYRWKITGEASNNSGGGVRVVFATTNSPTALPDIHDALRLAHPDDAWYWIESVICEGPVRSIFDDEPSIWKPAYRKVVANV